MQASPDPHRFRTPWLLTVAAVGLVGCHPSRGGTASSGDITVTHVVVPASPSPTDATAFLIIENHGAAPDTLLGASSPDAQAAILHAMVNHRMELVTGVAIPAGGRVTLAPGGYHLMLHGLARPTTVGDTLVLRLHFQRAGTLLARAPVLRYTEAVHAISPR